MCTLYSLLCAVLGILLLAYAPSLRNPSLSSSQRNRNAKITLRFNGSMRRNRTRDGLSTKSKS